MSSSSSRSHVVHIYRHLLKTSKYLPSKEKRADARLKIREGFKSNLNVEDQTVVQELLSKATSSLGYMKMITPKKFNEGQSGFTKIGEQLLVSLCMISSSLSFIVEQYSGMRPDPPGL